MPPVRTRKRPLPFGIPKQYEAQANSTTQPGYPPWTQVVKSTASKRVDGMQITASEGHPWPPRKGVTGDVGGDFSTEKSRILGSARTYRMRKTEVVPVFFNQYTATTEYTYDGPLLPFDPTVGNLGFNPWPDLPLDMRTSLDVMGAQAIARCKPTNSVADASVFLGETLKDGIPSMLGARSWKDRTLTAKNAGGEYLNYEFGWLPLVSDVRKLAYAVQHAHDVLAQYERDSGRMVRRRYDFPVEERTVNRGKVGAGAPMGPSLSQFFVGNSGTQGEIHRVDRFSRRVWFSGAFTYYLPSGYDSRSAMARTALQAKKLYGLSLSPEVLWNLAPWSWAVDWVSNAGDVFSNLSDWSQDGLVLRYGYIMEHVTMSSTFTHTGTKFSSGHNVQPLVYSIEWKKRRKANPFGFGVSWEGLSPRQIAIATALGITRS